MCTMKEHESMHVEKRTRKRLNRTSTHTYTSSMVYPKGYTIERIERIEGRVAFGHALFVIVTVTLFTLFCKKRHNFT
jgi:hypothetical protein